VPEAEEPRQVVVTFGRSVTDEDLARLQEHAEVIDAALFRPEVDEDHVHNHVVVIDHGPGDPFIEP